MRSWALLILIGLLGGCEKPKDWVPAYHPEYFAHWQDRMKERFPELQSAFGPSCLWRSTETEACFRMEKPQRWNGLLRLGLEESRFCPDLPWKVAEECSSGATARESWLSGNIGRMGTDPTRNFGLYRVEFIGRRTKYPGSFGHMGAFNHEIVVDQMISIRRLKRAAPPTMAWTRAMD